MQLVEIEIFARTYFSFVLEITKPTLQLMLKKQNKNKKVKNREDSILSRKISRITQNAKKMLHF